MTKYDSQSVRWRMDNSNHASGYFKRLIEGGELLLLRFVDRRNSGQGLPTNDRHAFPSLILFQHMVRTVNK